MEYFYEFIKNEGGLPLKAFIHNVKGLEMHWHKEIEIILILQGSIKIRVENEFYNLKEDDLILINSYEVHNINETTDDNVLLSIQMGPEVFSNYYPKAGNIVFNCKSFLAVENCQVKFDFLRRSMAKIIWELNKKRKGYKLFIGSEMHLLAAYLINNFNFDFRENKKAVSINKDIKRILNSLQAIKDSIDRNQSISLRDIADKENLSIYYLSRFIKEKMGMTFSDYLNAVRLDKAVNLLNNTDKSIAEITYLSGFPSSKAFNKSMKDTYGCSPKDYRKKIFNFAHIETSQATSEQNRNNLNKLSIFRKLFTYLKPMEHSSKDLPKDSLKASITMKIDIKNKGIAYQAYWKNLITFGRAADGLREEWQKPLRELQKEIGFEYIRLGGIFSDDMQVVGLGEDRNILYDWSYVDKIFDFLEEIEIKPFIELSLMREELETSLAAICCQKWYKVKLSNSYELWFNLIIEFIEHCIKRYGLKEVETWYFEVWSEKSFETGARDKNLEFYEKTVQAIKSISTDLRVGSFSSINQPINNSSRTKVALSSYQLISCQIEQEALALQESVISSKYEQEIILDRAGEEDIWLDLAKRYYGQEHAYEILINDTCYGASLIIKNNLQCIGKIADLGYWTFKDISEDIEADLSAFHGGVGLLNKNGLKKPAYFAYYLLSKLGDEILIQNDCYIVTKQGEDIQILAFNFEPIFLSEDPSYFTGKERYSILKEKPPKEMEFKLHGLRGTYKLNRYELNREQGSVYDEWVKIGAPENMKGEELDYLHRKSYPAMSIEYLNLEDIYQVRLIVPVHGAELVTLTKTV